MTKLVRSRPRSRSRSLSLAPLAALGLGLLLTAAACDKGDAKAEAGDKAGDKAGDAGAKAGDVGAPTAAEARTFLKEQSKKGCEMLTPAIVAKVLSVPEAELEQMEIGGCIYGWKSADGAEIVEASIMTIFVREDAAAAREWFDNATKDQTADEMRAALGMVMDKAKESEAVDTKAEEQAADAVGGMIGAMIPDEGYKYEDVAGVGDAARVLTHDGKLTVLVGNMVFTVGAYKGAPPPDLDISKIDLRDTKALMAASKQIELEQLAKTRDVRKQQAIELGKAVVAAL